MIEELERHLETLRKHHLGSATVDTEQYAWLIEAARIVEAFGDRPCEHAHAPGIPCLSCRARAWWR